MRVGRQFRRTVLRAAVGGGAGALAARAARRDRRAVAGAAAAGAIAGAAQEFPPAAVAAPAALVAARADPAAAATAAALGLATRRVWPVAPRNGADVAPRRLPDPDARPHPDGTGVRIVVNPDSGPALAASPTDELREALPGATVVELQDGDDLAAALTGGEPGDTVAIGAAGGDGTLNTAAAVAVARGVPLVAVPAGTLNHLARDLGLQSAGDAVDAVRAGTVTRMDVGAITGTGSGTEHVFVNTASFGAYTDLVDAREALEGRIGKWPALAVALVRVLRRAEPLRLEIDGRRTDAWLVFVGNCRYSPPGFGPSWRERLDDGLLDIRLVDGRHPWARTRLVLAVLTGTLARSAPYREWVAERLEIRSLDGPLRVAVDGETRDAGGRVTITKRPRALTVAVPPG